MQKNNNIMCFNLSYHVTRLAWFSVTRPIYIMSAPVLSESSLHYRPTFIPYCDVCSVTNHMWTLALFIGRDQMWWVHMELISVWKLRANYHTLLENPSERSAVS